MSVINRMLFETLALVGFRPEWDKEDGGVIRLPHKNATILMEPDRFGRIKVEIVSAKSRSEDFFHPILNEINDRLKKEDIPIYFYRFRSLQDIQEGFLYEDDPKTDRIFA